MGRRWRYHCTISGPYRTLRRAYYADFQTLPHGERNSRQIPSLYRRAARNFVTLLGSM